MPFMGPFVSYQLRIRFLSDSYPIRIQYASNSYPLLILIPIARLKRRLLVRNHDHRGIVP